MLYALAMRRSNLLALLGTMLAVAALVRMDTEDLADVVARVETTRVVDTSVAFGVYAAGEAEPHPTSGSAELASDLAYLRACDLMVPVPYVSSD